MITDKEFDDKLKNAISIAVKQDYIQLDHDLSGYSHTFSDEFNGKMNDLMRYEKVKTRRHKIKFSILVAAILLLISSTMVMANDSIREKIINMIITFYHDSVDISGPSTIVIDQSDDFEIYDLKYIPDDFSLEDKEDNPVNIYFADYRDQQGNVFYYTQSRSDGTMVSVSSDGKTREKIDIEGNIIYYITDGDMNSIVFEKEGYIYHISGNTDKDFLIKFFKKNFL